MKSPARRNQIQREDAAEPEKLRLVLNDILLDMSTRLEKLESAKGIIQLDDLQFDTGASVAAGTKPFDGTLRVACPDFTPTGLVLLRLERVRPAGQPILTAAADVKWRLLSGPKQGAVVVIDYVGGVAVNSSYLMRLGATRA